MDRREALKRVAMLMGGTLSASTISAVLSGCGAQPDKDWTPKLVSLGQNDLITTIAELIIPETDTPGAAAAGVNQFIDLMLADWLTAAEKDHFLGGLADVESRAQQDFGKRFGLCSAEEQIRLLKQLEKESLNVDGGESDEAQEPFFKQMKALTLIGYYTSEIGAAQELKYFEASDNYDGCVPLSEIGRSWSY